MISPFQQELTFSLTCFIRQRSCAQLLALSCPVLMMSLRPLWPRAGCIGHGCAGKPSLTAGCVFLGRLRGVALTVGDYYLTKLCTGHTLLNNTHIYIHSWERKVLRPFNNVYMRRPQSQRHRAHIDRQRWVIHTSYHRNQYLCAMENIKE